MAHRSHRKPLQNHHHLWYEKREYGRDSVLHRVRNRAGFIILMNLLDHRDLHAHMRSTPRPDREVSLELLRRMPDKEEGQSRTHQLDYAIGFMAMHGQELTAEHLSEQRLYIVRHPVIIDGVEHG